MAPIKSSLSRSVSKLLGVFRNEDTTLRGASRTQRFIDPNVSASGGLKTFTSTHIIHSFTTTGSDDFIVNSLGS